MKILDFESKIAALKKIYNTPLSSNRNGALYNAFSYATKISPESIAIFIACHTEIGATILDPFAGSGTTGLAAKLCDVPTPSMIETAKSLGLTPKWGKRKAILYELSTSGAFAGQVMCNPPSAKEFRETAIRLVTEVENELGHLYSITDKEAKQGCIRHVIWSDVLVCPKCKNETTFWEAAVKSDPLSISALFKCNFCEYTDAVNKIPRATENIYDEVLREDHLIKKRIPVKIYGKTKKKTWSRLATAADIDDLNAALAEFNLHGFPEFKINWGVLYRKGYHQGISHLHHFYTKRNAIVFSRLWSRVNDYPGEFRNALKLLLLSYNSSHSTLMTRVVVKQNSPDFVITGSQSGVLYISSLPIEKNIFEGVRRKISTLEQAFALIEPSKSSVAVFNSSSTFLCLPEKSINYVFTDPPFGDYIPYSEINQINEAWLGRLTNKDDEVIVNDAQSKGIAEYKELMYAVFSEVSRVLKDDGLMSLVFHSSKAEIWQALIDSYQRANLDVIISGILDKLQSSFKQTNSVVKVQGDPLLLLVKSDADASVKEVPESRHDSVLIREILLSAFAITDSPEEQKPERIYSRYINACLESGKSVAFDAGAFYDMIRDELPKYQLFPLTI